MPTTNQVGVIIPVGNFIWNVSSFAFDVQQGRTTNISQEIVSIFTGIPIFLEELFSTLNEVCHSVIVAISFEDV